MEHFTRLLDCDVSRKYCCPYRLLGLEVLILT